MVILPPNFTTGLHWYTTGIPLVIPKTFSVGIFFALINCIGPDGSKLESLLLASFLEKLKLVLHDLQHCVKHGLEWNGMKWIGVECRNCIISTLELNQKMV